MNTGRGVFLAIEGTDGSGKSTQFKRLVDRLTHEGHDVVTFDFPQYELPSSYFVREYLQGSYGTATDIGPYTGSLFYALDRFEAAPKIKEALAQGKVVIACRFVGSNMAHQGTKFRNAEERRGFFIWLDNLEYEMLRIPRPAASIVLRVPAEASHQLVVKRGQGGHIDNVHENDIEHLQKTVTVYDDLCQLFPRDFIRLDCTQDNQLLSIDAIHQRLWQRIEPLLPSVSKRRRKTKWEVTLPPPLPESKAASAQPAQASTPNSVNSATPVEASSNPAPAAPPALTAHLEGLHIALRNTSLFMASCIRQSQRTAYAELPAFLIPYDTKAQDGRYRYHLPPHFNAQLKEQYCGHMDQIFNLYSELVQQVSAYLERESTVPAPQRNDSWRQSIRLQAVQASRRVLPLAATTTIGIYARSHALEQSIRALLGRAVPEAYEAAKTIIAESRRSKPRFMEGSDIAGDVSYRTIAAKRMSALAAQQLPAHYTDAMTPVRLADVRPRNEFDLIPDMLYSYTNSPLHSLRDHIAGWSYEQKIQAFEAYIGNRTDAAQQPGPALEKAQYTWDITCSFEAFRDLQNYYTEGTIEWQELTPRYGYDIPELIEQAGLSDLYEACFDLSVRLHSLLIESRHPQEAQYAVLLGHNIRWKLTCSALQAFAAQLLLASPHHSLREAAGIVRAMHEQLGQAHPAMTEMMQVHKPQPR